MSKIAKVKSIYELTPMQEGMLFHSLSNETSEAYCNVLSFSISGILNIDSLEESFNRVIERYDVLRTVFNYKNFGKTVQVVLNEKKSKILYMDISDKNEEDKREYITQLKKQDKVRKFDLTKDTLMRLLAIKQNKEEYTLILSYHHIIIDGWCLGIVIRDLLKIYNEIEHGKEANLEMVYPYLGYIEWIREKDKEAARNYWNDYLLGYSENVSIPFEKGLSTSYKQKEIELLIGQEMTDKIEALAIRNKVTVSTVLQSIWSLQLQKYNNVNDSVFGYVVSGRNPEVRGIESMVGLFINTIPLRLTVENGMRYKDVLEKLNKGFLKNLEYDYYPLYEIQALSDFKGDLINNIMVFENYPVDAEVINRESTYKNNFKITDINAEEQTNYDFNIIITPKNGISVKFKFNENRFSENDVLRIREHFFNILNKVIENENIFVSDIEFIGEDEKKKLLLEFNDTDVEYPQNNLIHELFENQVEKTPDNIAARCEDKKLTYRELNEKANSVARVLRGKGVKGDSIVGIMVERSLEMIVGILGVLKAGGAYLPIDSTYPKGRVEYMLKDSGCEILLSEEKLIDNLEFNGEFIDLFNDDLFNDDFTNLDKINDSKNLAYVIYTSGTTGNPKGVMIEHKSLNNYIMYAKNKYMVEEDLNMPLYTSVSFDLTVTSIFTQLISGATIVVYRDMSIDKLMNKVFKGECKSVIKTTPAHLSLLKEINDVNKSIKRFIVGGEDLTEELAKSVSELFDDKVEIINEYGPTEATVGCIVHQYNHQYNYRNSVLIGKPINNAKIYILDENKKVLPIGVSGEIYIGGDILARGYLNRPELTAEKFVDNPFEPGQKMYKTGDLARWLSDGNMEFLGRIDNQVKIRGFRIELGEIENRLLQHEDVKEATVIVRENKQKEKYICAYVISERKIEELNLKSYLKETLPDYMIPTYFISLEAMPLTVNGKINKKDLPEPDANASTGRCYEAPRNELEEKLVEIWQGVLGISNIGINDNFFELGGHSLKLTVLIGRIEKELNIQVPLKEIFKSPTIKELSIYIEDSEKGVYEHIISVDEKEYYEVSSAQRRMYMVQQFDRDSIAYNIPKALIIDGKLEVQRLKKAIEMLIMRHESLRTSLEEKEGIIVQRIYDYKDMNFEIEMIEVDNDLDIDEKVNGFIRTFDLSKAPLFRVGLAKLGEERHLLLIDMNHIISDGVSIGIMIKEFGELYEGKELKQLRIQYKDYSAWQNKMQEDSKLKIQEEYWIKRFQGEIPVLNILTDYQRPLVKNFEGESVRFILGRKETEKLKEITRVTGCTMYMVLLANFKILLSKYSGQEDIIVGSPIAGRNHKDLESIIGMFVNTLAIRSEVNGNLTYEEYLNELKTITLDSYENQDYQFEDLVDKVKVERDISRNPLFDVMFVMQNMDMGDIEINELKFNSYEWKTTSEKFDITMLVKELDGKIEVCINYATSLYKRETIERMKKHYLKIVDEVIQNQAVKIQDIEIINEDEKRKVLVEFNNTAASFSDNKTIQELFEEQVERTPNNIAVVYGDEQITYRELNKRANAVAAVLREKGVGPDILVGIMVDRSIEMVVGIMGILKAGGGYLPIDPDYPEDRIKYMIEDSNIKILATQKSFIDGNSLGCELLDLNDEKLFSGKSTNLQMVNNARNIAYVIYTSGTTGKPKGVVVEHRGINNLTNMFRETFKIKPCTKILQFASIAFDAFASEIFMAILCGAELHVLPKEVLMDVPKLNMYMKNKDINIVTLPPVIANEIEVNNSKLEVIITAGSESKKALVDKLCKGVRYVNAYGPTEDTVCTTLWQYEDNEYNTVPIGKPIYNKEVYIVNKENKLVPIGVEGELCIGGVGLARGYLNQKELTDEKFVDNPYKQGERMYKTGDLARWIPDGNIEFLGRRDHQVKIRGFRIELGEIENTLRNIQGIKEAIVIDLQDNNNKYLCAYYTADSKYTISELRELLKNKLPDYMIPSYFIKLDQMPLNQNGKIDRKALPKPEGDIDTGEKYEEPRSELEEKLVEIWRDVLGVKGIGINNDFFSLGGDSIKAIQLISRAKAKGYNFEVKDLFQNPKIKDLSSWVKVFDQNIDQGTVKGEVLLTPIQKWFFEKEFNNNHHFNQCVMLHGEDGFEEEIIKKVFDSIVIHHDALRMVYSTNKNDIKQINRGIDSNLYDLEVYDFTDKEGVHDTEITAICNDIQASINLEKGPLVKIGLFKTTQGDHLLIAAHHLVIDGVSWRILFEDFNEGYKLAKMGKEIVLQEKTTSFKEWSEKLSNYASGYKIKNEVEFWNKVESSQVEKIPKDKHVDSRLARNTKVAKALLTEKETEHLLKRVNSAYNTEINDILLTSLALTINQWTNKKNVLINLESHGREEILKNTNISRTIGWFTSQYPLIIDIEETEDISTSIKNVKDRLRRIPNKGVGYGIIKYLGSNEIKDNINFNLMPEICFNYLGQFDEDINSDIFDISRIYPGEAVSLKGESICALDISGIVKEKKMSLSIAYNTEEYEDETIQLLLQNYKSNLCKIIEHCVKKEVAERTVSDITKEDIDTSELMSYSKDLSNIKKIYALTPMQEGMLFYSTLNKSSDAYHLVFALSVKGQLDVNLLEKSFNKLIERYDVLRTGFNYECFKKPMQMVFNERKSNINYYDIREEIDTNRKGFIDQLIKDDKSKKFDLSRDMLIRMTVVKTDDEEYTIVMSNHHIIMDGWCLSLITKDLFKIYNEIKHEKAAELVEVYPYSNYIDWINEKDKEEGIEYWANYLNGYNQKISIPFEEKNNESYKQKQLDMLINKETTKKIEELAKENKVTVNTIIQSIWAIQLQKYNNVNDSVFGYVVSGRNPEVKGIENMVGLFINTIPLRVSIEKDMTYKQTLNRINDNFLKSSQYDYCPLSEIQSLSEVKNDLINHIMVFENYPLDEEGINNELNYKNNFRITGVKAEEQTNYDFNIVVTHGNEIVIKFRFNENRFSQDNILKIQEHFVNILNKVIDNENMLVKDIEVIGSEEKKKLLSEFNNTKTDYPKDKTIHELFEEQVERMSNNVAVVYDGKSMTYKELNHRANVLAMNLVKKGVQPDDIIAIMMDRSIEMIIGIMAILKSGGAYLPIDPKHPVDRIRYILEDSGAKLLLVEKPLSDISIFDKDIIIVDDMDCNDQNINNLGKTSKSTNLAYVIYTSGSTGRAKGVNVQHNTVINTLNYLQENYPLLQNDCYLFKTNYTFDVSVSEIFGWFLGGGKLAILEKEFEKEPLKIIEAVEKYKITHINFTSSMFNLFLNHLNDGTRDMIETLKYVLTAGEALKLENVKNTKRLLSNIKLENLYGPTEASIYVTKYSLDFTEDNVRIPIGKPINNIECYILDNNSMLLPMGTVGELCIGGLGLARGYLNNEKLTNEKFVDNPYKQGEKMYKTGDLARWLPNGNIEFLGRIDHQVKIRGFRIELGEIENTLLNIQGIKEAIVVDLEDRDIKYLCSYYTSDIKYTVSELRELVKNKLPDYMIPSYFIKLDQMPLNQSGKIDRKALPKPEGSIDTGEKYEEPRNELEKKLVEIWSIVLGIKVIGINDDFFSLGGDSIKAIQLVAKAKAQGYNFEVKDVFQNPKIKDLSSLVKVFNQNIDQSIVQGDVPLTSIQKWFFEMEFKNSHHFNQGVMLHGEDRFEEEIIRKVFDSIVTHHDALRMVYSTGKNGIKQINRGIDSNLYDLQVYDFTDKEVVHDTEITDICNDIQASINLEKGPLVKLGLFKTAQEDHLLIAAHHLVIDGVSWRILFEDFNEGYKLAKMGKEIVLQEKTTSFKEWSEKLSEYALGNKIMNEVEFWNKVESCKVKKIPRDKQIDVRMRKNIKVEKISLSEKETEDLLKRVNLAYNTKINDILLASLALTIKQWTKDKNVLINLESHGREEILENTNISRTIGWFTSQYPLIINIEDDEDISTSIKNVKNSFRRIPNKGIGYGIIKYLSSNEIRKSIDFKLMPEICFNYLGQFDEDINSEIFNISNIYQGESASLDQESMYALDISGIVREKRMTISIAYSTEEYEDETIQLLLENYKNNLSKLIETCIYVAESEAAATIVEDEIDKNELLIENNAMIGSLVAMQKEDYIVFNEGKKDIVFSFPPISGYGVAFGKISKYLSDYTIYSFNFIERENPVDEYVRHITTLDKQENYVLMGYSGGGNLAFDVAKELEHRGYKVSDVILIDSITRGDLSEELKEGIYNNTLNGIHEWINNNMPEMNKYVEGNVGTKLRKFLDYTNDYSYDDAISANIHFIKSQLEENADSDDVKLRIEKLKMCTNGVYKIYQGSGKHQKMLDDINSEINAKIIRTIFTL